MHVCKIVELPLKKGNVAVAWRLPEQISDEIKMLQAYELIMKYLATTQV